MRATAYKLRSKIYHTMMQLSCFPDLFSGLSSTKIYFNHFIKTAEKSHKNFTLFILNRERLI